MHACECPTESKELPYILHISWQECRASILRILFHNADSVTLEKFLLVGINFGINYSGFLLVLVFMCFMKRGINPSMQILIFFSILMVLILMHLGFVSINWPLVRFLWFHGLRDGLSHRSARESCHGLWCFVQGEAEIGGLLLCLLSQRSLKGCCIFGIFFSTCT